MILRSSGVALLLSLIVWGDLRAQNWATKMFSKTSHDFGTLARGTKPEFAFELTNHYEETVRIKGVRSSCGCTIPIVTKSTLQKREKSKILCRFDTVSFLGEKNAVVTVTFDKPYAVEVRLQINGTVRRDVVVKPGVVQLGNVCQGTDTVKTIAVEYAGRVDWKIVDVRSSNSNFEVEMTQTQRNPQRVGYILEVRLKDSAPVGFINDWLTLVTNDHGSRTVTLPVEGRVVSPLTLSPKSLSLGEVAVGDEVSRRIIVRAKKAFRITEIHCDNCLDIKISEQSRKTHILPVKFMARDEPGKITKWIRIETDLGPGTTAECLATAVVTSVRR